MPEQIVENFCPACLAVPLIFASGGAAAITGMTPEEEEKEKTKRMWIIAISIITMLLSIGCWVYYRYYANCESCKI